MPPKKNTKTKKQAEDLVEANKITQKNLKKEEPVKNKASIPAGTGHHSDPLGDGKFSKKVIEISTWNLNGIRACNKNSEFVNYLKKKSPDVICLNETKIDATNFAKEKVTELIPKDYKQYWNFCKPPQKGYAGTAVLSKVAPISVIYDLDIPKHDQEGRTTTLEFENFYLVACYVPNAGEGLKRLDYRTKEWDSDFQNFLNTLRKKKATILCGDLNVAHTEIDLAKPKGNEKTPGFTPEERAGFDKYLKMGWVDTFRHFYPQEKKWSFWSYRTGGRAKNIGWRLDYFVIDKEHIAAVKDSQINDTVFGSDHCPLELTLELQKL